MTAPSRVAFGPRRESTTLESAGAIGFSTDGRPLPRRRSGSLDGVLGVRRGQMGRTPRRSRRRDWDQRQSRTSGSGAGGLLVATGGTSARRCAPNELGEVGSRKGSLLPADVDHGLALDDVDVGHQPALRCAGRLGRGVRGEASITTLSPAPPSRMSVPGPPIARRRRRRRAACRCRRRRSGRRRRRRRRP